MGFNISTQSIKHFWRQIVNSRLVSFYWVLLHYSLNLKKSNNFKTQKKKKKKKLLKINEQYSSNGGY